MSDFELTAPLTTRHLPGEYSSAPPPDEEKTSSTAGDTLSEYVMGAGLSPTKCCQSKRSPASGSSRLPSWPSKQLGVTMSAAAGAHGAVAFADRTPNESQSMAPASSTRITDFERDCSSGDTPDLLGSPSWRRRGQGGRTGRRGMSRLSVPRRFVSLKTFPEDRRM